MSHSYSIFEQLNGHPLSHVALKDLNLKKNAVAFLTTRGEGTMLEIADQLNTSVPKTTELIAHLSEEGLVRATGRKTEGLGRKAAIYTLNPDSCYFLGIEVRKYEINIGLMSFNAAMVETSLTIPFLFSEPEESLNAIIGEIKKFLAKASIPREKIIGLGLSMSGRINVKTSRILSNYHFAESPIKETLEAAIGLPVYIDNDSRTIAYGEYYFGRNGLSYQEKNVCIVNLDYGMSLGIFVDGAPIYGTSGYAGEIGHIPMYNNEKICFCGKKGCLETEASGLALIDFIQERMKEGSSSRLEKILARKGYLQLENVLESAVHGDNLAIEGITEIAHNLGKGLSVAINMLNPELIVLGGLLAEAGDILLFPVKTSIMQHSLSIVNSDTRIVLSSLRQKAGLPGCCLLVRNKMLGLI
ncbi:MAG TPA: ROK family protein [Puia sp.]|nr:ROK family protein [Puia sp.]